MEKEIHKRLDVMALYLEKELGEIKDTLNKIEELILGMEEVDEEILNKLNDYSKEQTDKER